MYVSVILICVLMQLWLLRQLIIHPEITNMEMKATQLVLLLLYILFSLPLFFNPQAPSLRFILHEMTWMLREG